MTDPTHEKILEEAENKALEALDKLHEENSEGMKQLAETERPFYRFFAVEYFGTGEGMSFWLMICRNYPFIGDKDCEKEKFVNFVGMGASYYMHGFEELTEDEFMQKYAELIPHHVKVQVHRRDQPMFTWETHLHVNYS